MLKVVNRQTFPDQITSSLTDYIASAPLRPGDLLPSTAELAAQFGVSRPVVREALKTLEGQGVIEVVNGKGAVVKPVTGESLQIFFDRAVTMSDDAIIELVEVRQPLEEQSARLAAERRTGEEASDLQTLAMAMRTHLAEPEAYARLDVEFHLLLASATRNQILYYLIGSIRETLHEAALAGLMRRQRREELERVQQSHEAILDAVLRSDADAAGEAMRRHFEETVAGLSLAAFRAAGAPAATPQVEA